MAANLQVNRERDKLGLQNYLEKFNDLSKFFDSMPACIFAIIDQNSNIVLLNRTGCQMLGRDSQAVMGNHSGDVLESYFPGIQQVIDVTIKNRSPINNFNLEIKSPDGGAKSYLVSTTLTVLFGKDDFVVILVLHDISEITRLRKAAKVTHRFGQLIGGSDNMKEVYSLIETIAQYDTTVLIYGETGTGKELAARTIHEQSPRSKELFVPINCSALTSSLLESELFGHVKGAFTGAVKDREGRFEMATGGTVFLDEIGSLSMDTQTKLLRTIQERSIERVGSSKSIPVDVRVISATNRDLTELIAKNEFRDDLYYRLKVFQINLPPLRERQDDIPILAEHFIENFNRLHHRNIIGLTDEAKAELKKYFWPGNVRELENAIEHALVLTPGVMIEAQYLPPEIRHMKSDGSPPPPPVEDLSSEEEKIRRALASAGGNIKKAAASLNMHRTTLWRKMREFGIKRFED